MHRHPGGARVGVHVHPVFAGLAGHKSQVGGVDLDLFTRGQLAQVQAQAALGQLDLGGVVVQPGEFEHRVALQPQRGGAHMQLGT